MGLLASCPRCRTPITTEGSRYRCGQHGDIAPLWRPEVAEYDALAEMLTHAADAPTYLPWPMGAGWTIADFGCVAASVGTATVTTTVGSSDLDGPIEVTIVSEDPGVGLGARCAGAAYVDPGHQIGAGPPAVKVRAAGRQVALWPVDTTEDADDDAALDDPLPRAVFAGEADGRWLWLVMRPGSAALLLHQEWQMADLTGFGPEALEMPFGGPRPSW